MMDKKKIKIDPIKADVGQEFAVKADHDWHGSDLTTDNQIVVDPGTGKPLILRLFEYSINPEVKHTPTKQELFNSHWRQIEVMLWGDGLVPRKDLDPRVEIGKNRGKGKYRIFILCEPRLGVMVADRPKTLQELNRLTK